jgi:membrane associated rhomboid family serine protease
MFPVADVIPSRTRPYVTIGLIAANTVFFAAELLAGEMLPRVIFARGLVPVVFSWPDLLSSMFLHAGWLHFLGNMLYLWIFGDNVEDRLGHGRFLAFYLACGVAAGLGHVAFNPHASAPAIGASGAISGVMGAYFVLYPQSRVLTAVFLIVFMDLVEVPAVYFLGIWFMLQLFSGVGSLGVHTAVGVAIWSHVVGFAAGAAAGSFWRKTTGYS